MGRHLHELWEQAESLDPDHEAYMASEADHLALLLEAKEALEEHHAEIYRTHDVRSVLRALGVVV